MKPLLERGTLSSALQRATQHALACGALQPIESALRDKPGFMAVPGLIFSHAFTWLEPALFEHDRDFVAHVDSQRS